MDRTIARASLALSAVSREDTAGDQPRVPISFLTFNLGIVRPDAYDQKSDCENWIAGLTLQEASESLAHLCDHIWCFMTLHEHLKNDQQSVLVHLSTGHTPLVEAARAVSPNPLKHFLRLGLLNKYKEIQKEFSLDLDWSDELESLSCVRNCLVHRGGLVSRDDCPLSKDGNSEGLRLVFRRLELWGKPSDSDWLLLTPTTPPQSTAMSLQVRWGVPSERFFCVGERLTLDAEMIQYLLYTVFTIGRQLVHLLGCRMHAS